MEEPGGVTKSTKVKFLNFTILSKMMLCTHAKITVSEQILKIVAQKFDGALVNPAFPEDWLQHNRAGVVVDRRAQTFQIILLHECNVIEQRLESLAVLFLSGKRERTKVRP